MIIWITGLEAAGKTTVASAIAGALSERGVDVVRLDGDTWRHMTLSFDLSPDGRHRNVQRAMQVAVSLDDARTVIICSFVSPNREQRQWLKSTHDAIEVYLHSSRRKGDIKPCPNYEPPVDPDFSFCTDTSDPWDVANHIINGISSMVRSGSVAAVAGWQPTLNGGGDET